ncbi:MAG: heparinase II/III family protein [Armatimonadota bacterium]|nr:heparinase II/III family protein [Armatimonadota bacterium]
MARITLILACLLVVISNGAVSAGPALDEILNYMFLDQSVPLSPRNDLFDTQRTIELTRETPLGQTFTTGPETDRIVRIRAYLPPFPGWRPGEGAELVLWDSPKKNVSLGRYTNWYNYRGFAFKQAEWEINARVKPSTPYYFEISYIGKGDGKLSYAGVMNGADAYKPGQGYLAGKEADFDMCFQIHSKKAPDPVGNLKRMFARFDLDRPELSEIRQAVEKQDFEAAIAKTVAYFEARKKPIAIIDTDYVIANNPAYDTSSADLALQHWFYSNELALGYAGPDMNWRAQLAFDEKGAAVASHSGLNSSGLRNDLARAYINTGNEKYIRKFNSLLLDWFTDNPPPPVSHIGGASIDPVWNSLGTGLRLGQGLFAYCRAYESPEFTTECRMAYMLNMADHADTLLMVGEQARGNWSFTQNSSLLAFSMNFPEFRNAPKWRDAAIQRLAKSIKEDYLPDGVEMESAPGYQRMAYNPLARNVYDEMIVKRGITTPFAVELRSLLEKQAEYFMFMAMPNGITPFLGDWGADRTRPQILEDSKRFNRKDMLYVATAGKEGIKPKELSKLYPYCGIVTMRSDWGGAGRPYEDARYTMLHGLHFGAHGHSDINSMALYAYGRELLADPGSHIYGSPEHKLLTTAVSHNLMTVDGEDQNKTGNAAFKNWSTTPIADYLSSWLQAYTAADYNREVFYIRANNDPGAKDYLVIRDTAEGNGTHSLEQRWHFPLDSASKLDNSTLKSATAYADKGNLAIWQVDPARLQAEQTTIDTWHPAGTDKEPGKLPTVIYKTTAQLPAAMDTALIPFEGKSQPRIQMKTLQKSADGLDSVFKIMQGNIEDLFIFQRAAGPKSLTSEKISFDGERLFVRRIGGKLRSLLLINGKSVSVNGERLAASKKRLLWVAISFDKSGMKVYTSSNEPTLVLGAKEKKTTVTNMDVGKLLRAPSVNSNTKLNNK